MAATTVLLVDDHEVFRSSARAELEDGGFDVVAREREPVAAALTGREREVVELAARGLTNREVADRL